MSYDGQDRPICWKRIRYRGPLVPCWCDFQNLKIRVKKGSKAKRAQGLVHIRVARSVLEYVPYSGTVLPYIHVYGE